MISSQVYQETPDLDRLSHELMQRDDYMRCRHVGHCFEGDGNRKGRCHDNVRSWITDHGGDRRLFGWLVDCGEEDMCGQIKFYAHSVVLSEGGEFVDVTLASNDQVLPFLVAQLPESVFDIVAKLYPVMTHVVDRAKFEAFQSAIATSMLLPRTN